MKKIILGLTVITCASTGFAQKNKVLNAYNYNKAFARSQKCSEVQKGLENINEAIEHEQTKGEAKTWYYRGNLYYNILASKDQACKSLDADALEKCTDSYLKALTLNFDDPELKKLDLKKEDGSDIMKFFGALQNKSKVDDEMYTMDIMGRKFPGLAGEYANKGIEDFGKKDYKGAQESFSTSLLLSSFTGKMDTMVMYNAALASEYAGDNKTAKQLYDGLIGLKYNIDGNGAGLYSSMSKIYKAEGDSAKAFEYIQKGRVAYPNDNNLVFEEIDYYRSHDQNDKALASLDVAITNNPKLPLLYFAKGNVYEATNENDKAIEAYKKAIEIQPDYYDANFNLGAYYFNSAADKVNEANKLPLGDKKYDVYKEEAKGLFAKAIPYIETANKAKPEDVDTANMLIKLYTQTGEYEKAKVLKAKYTE